MKSTGGYTAAEVSIDYVHSGCYNQYATTTLIDTTCLLLSRRRYAGPITLLAARSVYVYLGNDRHRSAEP